MTFDEWWKEMKPAECDELKEEFVGCWEARDAEVAELKEDVTMLRRKLQRLVLFKESATSSDYEEAEEALAATEHHDSA